MTIVLRIGLAAAGLMCTAAAPLQDDPAATAAGKAREAYRAGRYLEAVDLLQPFALDSDGKVKSQFAYQYWRQMRTSINDAPFGVEHQGKRPLDASDRAILNRAQVGDAIAAIVARARETRVVILNENHSASRDRAFGLAVARALRPLGYDTLALEALSNDAEPTRGANRMEALRLRGYPIASDGYYLRDPEFADFLRQSLAIGYRPLAYEATRYDAKAGRAASIASREQQQADSLAAFLTRHPNGKLLIYVGFSHVAEAGLKDESGPSTYWMASRLKRMTHVDPLTIDQTTIGDRAAWPEAYDTVAARVEGRDGVLMIDAMPAVVGQYRGAVDLQIVHAPGALVHGRPDWLAAMGRHPVEVPAAVLPGARRRLVQAFLARERGEAIPLDQIVVEAGKAPPPLMLSDEAVRYATQDGAAQ